MQAKNTLITILLILFVLTSCVERGKPINKEAETTTTKTAKKIVEHYTCPKGHKGAASQGKCPTCGSVYLHNQAFHGNAGLVLPTSTLKDPFQEPTTNSGAAQNAYGDYHYICPTGHVGGAASAVNCTTCDVKLVHNQLYHK